MPVPLTWSSKLERRVCYPVPGPWEKSLALQRRKRSFLRLLREMNGLPKVICTLVPPAKVHKLNPQGEAVDMPSPDNHRRESVWLPIW